MKKILIGLLVFGNLSAFAAPVKSVSVANTSCNKEEVLKAWQLIRDNSNTITHRTDRLSSLILRLATQDYNTTLNYYRNGTYAGPLTRIATLLVSDEDVSEAYSRKVSEEKSLDNVRADNRIINDSTNEFEQILMRCLN